VAVPVAAATRNNWGSVRTSSSQAAGSEVSATARTTSLTTSTHLRRHLSTQAPAGRPMTRKAAVSRAVRTPISSGVACRIVTARTGSASTVIWVPT
jgi:hypothetical protein